MAKFKSTQTGLYPRRRKLWWGDTWEGVPNGPPDCCRGKLSQDWDAGGMPMALSEPWLSLYQMSDSCAVLRLCFKTAPEKWELPKESKLKFKEEEAAGCVVLGGTGSWGCQCLCMELFVGSPTNTGQVMVFHSLPGPAVREMGEVRYPSGFCGILAFQMTSES